MNYLTAYSRYFTNADVTVDSKGIISAVASGTAGTDTTYDLSCEQTGSDNFDPTIRLTDSTSGTDNVQITGGTNVTVTRVTGDKNSISASGGGSGTMPKLLLVVVWMVVVLLAQLMFNLPRSLLIE